MNDWKLDTNRICHFFHSVLYDIELHGNRGEPIWVRTRSNHWSGPLRWSSIQQGVDVTVCLLPSRNGHGTTPYFFASTYLYSAPQPLTKDILIVHILVNWYTASKPWLTDCDKRAANSWLLNIFRLQPGIEKDFTVRGFWITRGVLWVGRTWRNLTHCRWMPSITLVTIWWLDENAWIAQTLRENFATFKQ